MTSISTKPKFGRLIWIENGTGREVVIKTGQFALLNFHKNVVKSEPQFANGTFKITY